MYCYWSLYFKKSVFKTFNSDGCLDHNLVDYSMTKIGSLVKIASTGILVVPPESWMHQRNSGRATEILVTSLTTLGQRNHRAQ